MSICEETARRFFHAASKGDEVTLLKILDDGFDINHVGPKYENALHIAVEFFQVRCVQFLLENGADVNLPVRSRVNQPLVTPLDLAVDVILDGRGTHYPHYPGDPEAPTELIWMLLAYGADPLTGLKAAKFYRSHRIASLLENFRRVRWTNQANDEVGPTRHGSGEAGQDNCTPNS